MADIDDQVRRVVNGYRRQEISEKYNAVFSESNPDLSPIVESEWLDYVEEFERQFETAAEIPLRTYLGDPGFRPVAEIPVDELEDEMAHVIDVLAEQNVCVDFLFDIELAEAYRFVTEELLDEEITNIRIPDTWVHYIYEEFHPNDVEDVKQWVADSLDTLLNGQVRFLDLFWFQGDSVELDGHDITGESLQEIAQGLPERLGFGEIVIDSVSADVAEDTATAQATLHCRYLGASDAEGEACTAVASAWLNRSPYGGWDIVKLALPFDILVK